MKKLFLLFIASAAMLSVSAQYSYHNGNALHLNAPGPIKSGSPMARTTSFTHDSLLLTNIGVNDTVPQVYTAGYTTDSGYIFGTSLDGFDAFAERYDFTAADSSVQVLGILTGFTGTVNGASTNNATFKAWTMGSPVAATSTLTYSGFPSTVLDSVVVPFTSLTLNNYAAYWFATPTAYLTSSHFFVGYTLNYTWGSTNGDTIGTVVSGNRVSSVDSVIGGVDTIVNDQSVIGGGGNWYDLAWDVFNPQLLADYYLLPIVNTQHITISGVKGITNKNFTFIGAYPNPAVNSTNVKFSLSNNSDVLIRIMDINGRVINTDRENNLAAGEHITNINTTDLAVGDYLIAIQSVNGGGIATKLTIIK